MRDCSDFYGIERLAQVLKDFRRVPVNEAINLNRLEQHENFQNNN